LEIQAFMRVAAPVAFAIAATVLFPPADAAPASQASAAPPQAPVYRVLRSTSGSKGHVAGQSYVIDDPRTVFRVPEDRQVIVHFEWEGPAGRHRLEGLWRNPDGRVSTISDFTHESRGGRIAAYWELALPESPARGTWTLEARIDGQPAGSHTFEIVAGAANGPPPTAAPARTPLTTAQLYQKILGAIVVVQKIDGAGRAGLTAAAFAIAPDRVVTPFHVIDGAATLRLTSPGGQTEDVTTVVSFSRNGDWAILPVTALKLQPLARPGKRDVAVGSSVFGLNVAPTGEWVIYGVQVGGTSSRPAAGERLVMQAPIGWRSAGTPLTDEYGDAVAITGSIWEQGTAMSDGDNAIPVSAASAVPMQFGGSSLAVPLDGVADDGKGTHSLAELAVAVPFIPMMGPSNVHVARGTTAQSMKKAVGFFETIDQRARFAKTAGLFAVVLDLLPKQKLNGLPVAVSLHALNGTRVAATKPLPLKGEANRPLGVGWTIDANLLPTGIYRLDVGGDNDVMWRTFIEIVP
jgi:hypothetical protein